MRTRRWLLVALATACGPISSNSPPPVPYNTCPCDGYPQQPPPTCAGDVCAASSDGTSSWTLVVSIPDTAFIAPTLTFAVPFTQAGQPLPGPADVGGDYEVQPQVALQVDYDLHNSGQETSLPVQTSYVPVVPEEGVDGGYIDAVTSGLPLLPTLGGPGSFPNAPGPAGGPPQSYAATLPPGLYERRILPVAPFNQVFPPDVRVVPAAAGRALKDRDELVLDVTTLQTQVPQFPQFIVKRDDGGSLEGWSLYLRDARTKRTISPVQVLAANAPPEVYLYTNHLAGQAGDALDGAEVVLEPPPGEVPTFPTYAVGENAGAFTPAVDYPLVDPSLPVEGTIVDPNGAPVPADVVFYAPDHPHDLQTGLVDQGKITFDPNLSYSTTLAAPQGVYVANLPAGNYAAVATPRSPGLAKMRVSPFLQVQKGTSGLTVLAPPFRLPWQNLVTGTCRVADGRTLSGAHVQATPAVALLDAKTPPEQWPRPASANTDSAGRFALQLDPGEYDITVKPALETALPWLVTANVDLTKTGDVNLGVLSVPAPVVAKYTLLDPSSNVIRYALVQVFAVPPGGRQAAVEIGHTLTDEAGNYALYLTPPVSPTQ